MSQWLKQSTAFTFRLGPFLDSTDGNTQENALTIAYTDVLLSKAGGALTAKNDTTNLTTTGVNAHYTCVLNTTDTGTLGAFRVWCHVAGALAVWQDFMVLPANVYDSFVAGSDLLDVNTAQWLGTACATPTIGGVPEVDLTHVAGATTNVAALATNVDAILTDTGTTLDTKLNNMSGATFDTATDSLEALRNRGDAAWVTATGFSTHSAADVWAVGTRALTDKSGFSLTQVFPTNFADLAITVTTGRVTAGTVSDKTGYSLTQTFPTNFSSMSITAGGLMDINLAQTLSALVGYPTTVGGSLYFIRQLEKNKLVYNKSTDVMTLYDDDGTTAKGVAHAMVDDASGATRNAS